ncbi:hypothetical protein L218DRAFT_494971 [Marasmius fiardii PR-910]|nr:hypothetical protein L218DRAFT_494971 [Marasmius fiardii PR-910]
MINYSEDTTSKFTLFTSIIGFSRVGFFSGEDGFQLTKNLAYDEYSDLLWGDQGTFTRSFLHIHEFLLHVLIVSKPQLIPPSLHNDSSLQIPPTSTPSCAFDFLKCLHSYASHLLLQTCLGLIKYASTLIISSVAGEFTNQKQRHIPFFSLRLGLPPPTLLPQSKVIIDKDLSLVLKGFYKREVFERERRAYEIIERQRIRGVPNL